MTDTPISGLAQVAYKPTIVIPGIDPSLNPGQRNIAMPLSALAPSTIAAGYPSAAYKSTLMVPMIDPSLPVGQQGVLVPASNLAPASVTMTTPQVGYKPTLLFSATDPSLPVGAQSVTVVGNILAAALVATRTRMNGTLNLYVSPGGSDVNNTGLSAASPFGSIGHAWQVLVNNYDLNGFQAVINCAAGTYTSPNTFAGQPVGFSGSNPVRLTGAGGSSSIIAVTVVGGVGLSVRNGAVVTVDNIGFSCPGGAGLQAIDDGTVSLGLNVAFGTCGSCHMIADNRGKILSIAQSYQVTGGAPAHAQSYNGGYLVLSSSVVTLVGSPRFPSGFLLSAFNSIIAADNMTFIGSTGAVSLKFYVAYGLISTNGASISAMPGDGPGVQGTGGYYV